MRLLLPAPSLQRTMSVAATHALDANVHLVDCEWLASRLGSVTVLDASWYMPADKRDPGAEFEAAHIPAAQRFDVDAFSDTTSSLPHMLPPADTFSHIAARLGLSHSQSVIVYDTAGVFSAPRVWWTLRALGHERVAVLDGGLPAWRAAGLPLETGAARAVTAPPETWRLVRSMVAEYDAVHDATSSLMNTARDGSLASWTIVDARSTARFTGSAPEPRAHLSSGHMPGARSVPFGDVLSLGRFKPPHEIRAVFQRAGVPEGTFDTAAPERVRVITTCGSGVTAAVLYLALVRAGKALEDVALYDGSWTEWAARSDRIVKGDAGPPLR